jgi:YHS domain-containing protein
VSQRYLDPVDPSQQRLPVLPLITDHDSQPTVKDPVCGMNVVPGSAAGSVDHEGTTYYFCSRHCVEKFRADALHYLAGASPSAKPASPPPAGSTFTCPMHPEIVGDKPGSCPICGMALEPLTLSAEPEADPELSDMTRRFWVAVVLTIPLLVLSMADMVPGLALPGLLTGNVI